MRTLRFIDPNDYEVLDDGQPIGRIRYAKERSPGRWLWSMRHGSQVECSDNRLRD